ncbi:hypothetical protein GGI59_004819 [Rhizobium lentis]|uniref:Uncharacterized protein n=1 Tax=Rhizobium lentis TaxID=1138194 RepID=A0A7W9CX50_9HYPH|nr:hypothetical protein [Rhizobium lentis]
MNGFNSMAELGIFSHGPTEPLNDLILKDYREPVIEFICQRCDRHGTIERKLLVKAFGGGASFAVLRRRMAMGCACKRRKVTNAARTSHVWRTQMVPMEVSHDKR